MQMKAASRVAKVAVPPGRSGKGTAKTVLLGIGGLGFLAFAVREIPSLIREIKIERM
jgi:hypothetical protein